MWKRLRGTQCEKHQFLSAEGGVKMNEPDRQDRIEKDVDTGRKGGAASMAGAVPMARADVIEVVADRVAWAPVWAGLVVALPIQLVLSAIGFGIALGAYNPASANFSSAVASWVGWWSAVSMLIAFFVGGYLASRLAAVRGLSNGWLHGSLVWALAMLIGVILGATGAVGFGSAFSGIQALMNRGMSISGAEAQSVVSTAASATWWFVGGAILSWFTAVIGGLIGASARPLEHPIERT